MTLAKAFRERARVKKSIAEIETAISRGHGSHKVVLIDGEDIEDNKKVYLNKNYQETLDLYFKVVDAYAVICGTIEEHNTKARALLAPLEILKSKRNMLEHVVVSSKSFTSKTVSRDYNNKTEQWEETVVDYKMDFDLEGIEAELVAVKKQIIAMENKVAEINATTNVVFSEEITQFLAELI